MTNKVIRFIPPRPQQLLMHLLETSDLVPMVQSLNPRHLGKLIDYIGIEDASEIISMTTTEQLLHLFDEDLWRKRRPGRQTVFRWKRWRGFTIVCCELMNR